MAARADGRATPTRRHGRSDKRTGSPDRSDRTSAKPRGRDEVRGAIFQAATDLFSQRNPDAVSIRDIAARAGVNHALVHRHFGSKQELLGAVLNENASSFSRELVGVSDLGEAVGPVFRQTLRRGPYVHLLARASMDGLEPERRLTQFPTIEAMVRMAAAGVPGPDPTQPGPERFDPRLIVATIVALGFGWKILEGLVVRATGLEDVDREVVRAEVATVMRAIAAMTGGEPLDPADHA